MIVLILFCEKIKKLSKKEGFSKFISNNIGRGGKMMKIIYSRKRKEYQKKVVLGLVICLLVFFFIFNIHSVDAGMNDSTMLKNRVDGIYAVTSLNGENHLYYLDMYTMNGRISYCIDLGKKVTSELYHSTNDFSISSLSKEQIQYVQSISYFGYQYPGHDDYRFYMAAQEIIWEYLSGAEVGWTKVLDINGDRMDIESFKEEIFMLRDQFYRELYFGKTSDWVVQAGARIFLTDYSGSLDFYEVSFYQNSDVKIEGNLVTIQTDDHYVGRSNIILSTKDVYSYESQLYYYEDSQRLISNGNIDRLEYHIWFYTEGSNVHIQLVDGDSKLHVAQGQASLKGAVYQLCDENGQVIETFSTDESGRAELENLVRGHYTIQQVEASLGYLLNPEVIEFEIDSHDLEITLEEYVIKNSIELIKFYGKEEEEILLEESVEFYIMDEHGTIYDVISTNEFGTAFITLPYGTYIFKQNNTTYGYSKVDDFKVVVDQESEEVKRYQLIDSLIETKVQVITFLRDSQEIIPSNEFMYRIKDQNTSQYLEYDGKTVFSTDDSGQLIFPFLVSYGDYVLEQVSIPYGYILNSEGVEFSVDEQSNLEVVDGKFILNLEFYNSLLLGTINIVTNEEVFHSYLNGYDYEKRIRGHIELSLIAQEDIDILGQVYVQKGEEVGNVVTDEQGNAILDGLYLGSYCLLEKESGLEYCFDLREYSKDVFTVHKDIELTILMEKTDLILKNVSEDGTEIEGSIFELYDQDNSLIYTGITNEDGFLKVSTLPKGQYCLHQKEVPSSYLLYSEDICFQITDASNSHELKIINQKVPKKWISVPNTFSNQKGGFKLLLLISILIGIGVFYYQKVCCSSKH